MNRRVFVKKFSLTVLGSFVLPLGFAQKKKTLWGIPISPELLNEEGKLSVKTPKGKFDPEKSWEQTWRVWFPGRGKPGKGSGFISVKKVLGSNEEAVSYSIEQAISENNKWLHFTKASIETKNNAYGTPVNWRAVTEFISSPRSGKTDDEVHCYKESTDTDLKQEGEDVCINFTLLYTVQRMSSKGTKQLSFTLYDELDKVKKNHVIRYVKRTRIPFGDNQVEVACYEQIGEGSLPWMYYLDKKGRLLLAISGMRVLVNDAHGHLPYFEKYPVLNKVSIQERPSAKSMQPEVSKETRRPNILFLSTDQQAWNTISAFGNKFVHTPIGICWHARG